MNLKNAQTVFKELNFQIEEKKEMTNFQVLWKKLTEKRKKFCKKKKPEILKANIEISETKAAFAEIMREIELENFSQ